MTTLQPPTTIRLADIGRDFAAIIGLYRAHGWTHASDPTRLRLAVESSSLSIVAVTPDDRVVGFARAMSDEAFAVYIADILVAPDHQRQGIVGAWISVDEHLGQLVYLRYAVRSWCIAAKASHACREV